ncbi:MAG: ferredoxin [Desulfobulbaceae bacterium]|nr:ferredoxin [Desulfobulbaceae bacterium]
MNQIVIDTYLCNGCGTCVEICPEVFRLDTLTEKAALTVPEPAITGTVLQAASFCPEKCIAITSIREGFQEYAG